MNHLSILLPKLLFNHDDFCCLCLKTIEGNRSELDDEVVLLENHVQKTITVSEIFSYVFGEELFSNISTFKEFCMQCVTLTVNSYKYIKEVKDNVLYLREAIDYVDNCISQTSQDVEGYNTLFVYLTQDLSTSNHYYSNFASNIDAPDLFKKFCGIKDSAKVEFKAPVKKKNRSDILQMEKDKNKNMIGTKDMLFDKYDPSNLKCKDCLKKFDSVPKLRNHYLRVHAPKIYKCPDCPRSYGSKSILNTHQTSSHICDMCSECGKIFNNAHSLREHEQSHYLRIVCQDCGRVYKNRNTYKMHFENNVCQTPVRNSPANAKYTCDYCQKKYTQKSTLRVHIQYEHGNYKYLECKWCKKKFWCQSRLNAHIVKHTKEKNFNCSICNGKFVTKESLLYHTRIHTGEKPYPCHLCNSKFLSASRRTAHIRSHHTNPTVECDVCHSKFKSIQYLMKHKKTHENFTLDEDNLEQENAEKSIPENIKVQNPEVNNDFDINNSLNKLVYNAVKMEDSVIRIEMPESEDTNNVQRNVEYYFIGKSESNEDDDQPEQIYLEVTENIEV